MSLAELQHYFRTRRNQRLVALIDQVSARRRRAIKVLDVGGRAEFWKTVDVSKIDAITVTNIDKADIAVDAGQSLIRGEYANALDLSGFRARGYDLVVCNSVIEHLETWRNIKTCARELRSVAEAGFIQTPSFWFPVEQHFMIPFFHWAPAQLRASLLPYLPRRGYEQVGDVDVRRAYVEEINLLTRREFAFLFPDAEIVAEKVLGLTKSYTAIWGVEGAPALHD